MENVLLEQEIINASNKYGFVENKTDNKHHVLIMQ